MLLELWSDLEVDVGKLDVHGSIEDAQGGLATAGEQCDMESRSPATLEASFFLAASFVRRPFMQIFVRLPPQSLVPAGFANNSAENLDKSGGPCLSSGFG